jgi:hypothetical protein
VRQVLIITTTFFCFSLGELEEDNNLTSLSLAGGGGYIVEQFSPEANIFRGCSGPQGLPVCASVAGSGPQNVTSFFFLFSFLYIVYIYSFLAPSSFLKVTGKRKKK